MTVESFTEWKEKFDAEMAEAHTKTTAAEEEKRKKLTGRELFEQNKAVVEEESESFWEMEAEAFEEEGTAGIDDIDTEAFEIPLTDDDE